MIEKQLSKSQLLLRQRWVKIGTVGKAHGLHGAFFISGRDNPLDSTIQLVRLGRSLHESESYKVLKSRMQGKRPLLHCEGVSSRDGVESLKSVGIWCLREQIAIDETAEYLWADLIGRTLYDKDRVVLGRVIQVVNYGASDIIEVEDQKGRLLGIPFVSVYIDMDFAPDSDSIQLKVAAAIFDDAWEDQR